MQQKTMNFWSHIRNIKHTLIGIPIGLVIGTLCYLISNRDDMVIYIFVVGYLLAIIPVVLIHINYIKIDKDKILTIEKSSKSIEITDNHILTKIDISEIMRIILTTGLERGGISFWSSYYYYQIDLKNEQTIFITSLLLKPKEFPFKVDLKRHIAFPFAKHFDPDNDIILKQSKKDDDEILINNFYKKYSDYSLDKLIEIVENKKIYEKFAVIAAERLLNEKNYGCQHTI